jgi:hypothetical protein
MTTVTTGPTVVRRMTPAQRRRSLQEARRSTSLFVRLSSGQVRRIEQDVARRAAPGTAR